MVASHVEQMRQQCSRFLNLQQQLPEDPKELTVAVMRMSFPICLILVSQVEK
jgi:hypothetical protein